MSDLRGMLESIAETLAEYARQLRSGEYAQGNYEPTVSGVPLREYPLEIVDERGREFAVVLCIGGPHIEIVADGWHDARLAGYWWGESETLWEDAQASFTTVLDYFIKR